MIITIPYSLEYPDVHQGEKDEGQQMQEYQGQQRGHLQHVLVG
jgi:hypothetical protein